MYVRVCVHMLHVCGWGCVHVACVHTCVWMCVPHVCILHVCAHVCMSMHVCVGVYVCAWVYVCVHICACCMCMHIYMCMCACVHRYTCATVHMQRSEYMLGYWSSPSTFLDTHLMLFPRAHSRLGWPPSSPKFTSTQGWRVCHNDPALCGF